MATPAAPAAPATAEEIYSQVVKTLPPSERLKLATMILNDIPPQSVVDYSDDWSEEDMRDLTAHSMQYAAQSFGEEVEDSAEGG
jgi:hypothetical protein